MKKNNFFKFNLPDKIFGLEKALLTLFLPLLGLLILFLITLNLILLPKITEIGSINKEKNVIKDNTAKIDEQNKYLMSIDKEELKRNADYLDNAVLKDKKFYLLVSTIRNIASNFDYQLESFSLTPGEIKKEDEVAKAFISEDTTKMPVTLSMVGPKEKSLDLVLALEKTLPILFIDKFETKISGDLSQLNLMVSSYYINDKAVMETKDVSLSDLVLSKEESDLIKRISTFNKPENIQVGIGASEFQQYQRENPFSL